MRAVTNESMWSARLKHDRLPVPSVDDIKEMQLTLAKQNARKVKTPQTKSVSRKDCENAVLEAAKMGIDRTMHVMFAGMLLANLSVQTAREIARCVEEASDMYRDGQINDWDIEKQILDEWGIEFHKNRTWGLKK